MAVADASRERASRQNPAYRPAGAFHRKEDRVREAARAGGLRGSGNDRARTGFPVLATHNQECSHATARASKAAWSARRLRRRALSRDVGCGPGAANPAPGGRAGAIVQSKPAGTARALGAVSTA